MQSRSASYRLMHKLLDQIHQPENLDSHPWTKCLVVQNMGKDAPLVASARPGEQLVLALRILFLQMLPDTPPRPGRILDSRWGQFGILAAKYFAPLEFGVPFPISLQKAWSRIDASILLFVRAEGGRPLSQSEQSRYQLVGGEPEVTHVGTLNEWHKKGIEKLTAILLAYEGHLRQAAHLPAQVEAESREKTHPKHVFQGYDMWKNHIREVMIGSLMVLGLTIAGLKVWNLYESWTAVQSDVSHLQTLSSSQLDSINIQEVNDSLIKFREDIEALKSESGLLLWMCHSFGWLPYYGADLAAAEDMLNMSDLMSRSAELTLQALQPILVDFKTPQAGSVSKLSSMVNQLQSARPQLLAARAILEKARQIRTQVDAQQLSPGFQGLFSSRVDPLMARLDDVLSISLSLPDLLGATDGSPRTYLLLIENEDELRPTGGFITSVGTLEIMNGRILGLSFEDSGSLDDWSKPYPLAPWQLDQYMNSPVLVFRDSNWFVDYPTTVKYAKLLYLLGQSTPVTIDGVIALNQQVLISLLKVLGPVRVDGVSYPITSSNVVDYMRSAKEPPPSDEQPSDWYRKAFISKISQAVLDRLLSPGGADWNKLSVTLLQLLDERQILIQVNNVDAGRVVARNGWDGALQPGSGDYLYVVDSNVGFNKTNAVVNEQLSYDVDLSDTVHPTSLLSVIQSNHASSGVPCMQWDDGVITTELWYPIDRCYWDYLRVYQTSHATLQDATPHAIPADWTILGDSIPPQVDILDDGIDGIQGYGTLVVVPGGQSTATSFKFSLPASVLAKIPGSDQSIYRLKIQKQPGTLSVPVTIRIHFPNNVSLVSMPAGAFIQDNNVMVRDELNTDLLIEIVVRLR